MFVCTDMATPRQRLLGMPIEQLGFVVALTVKVIAEQEVVLATWDIRSENRERASRQKEDAFSCP